MPLITNTNVVINIISIKASGPAVPHCVKQCAVVLQPEQLVGRCHVVCDGLLAVKEEGVGRPDIAGQQIVQREHLHWSFKAEPLILPALAEEHVNRVFLRRENT